MSLQSIGGAVIPGAGPVPPAGQPVAATGTPRKTDGVGAVEATPGQARQPTEQELQHAVSDLQKAVAPLAQDLQFSIDKDSGRTVVKVVDSATDKVLKQYPSEEALAMSQSIGKFQQGLLVKQKV